MMIKSLAAGLLSIAALATPAMAQVVTRDPGVMRHHNARTAYVRGDVGARYMPAAGYYYGGQGYAGPRVGAFATAPWSDGPYASYGAGVTPAPSYYYGARSYAPGPHVGAFATAPWADDASYGYGYAPY
jgi:hypothetical protein